MANDIKNSQKTIGFLAVLCYLLFRGSYSAKI